MRWSRRKTLASGLVAVGLTAILTTGLQVANRVSKTVNPFKATYKGEIISPEDYPREHWDKAKSYLTLQFRDNPNANHLIFKTQDKEGDAMYLSFMDYSGNHNFGDKAILKVLNNPEDGRKIARELARASGISDKSVIYEMSNESLQRIIANPSINGKNSYISRAHIFSTSPTIIDISPEYIENSTTRPSNRPMIFKGLIGQITNSK